MRRVLLLSVAVVAALVALVGTAAAEEDLGTATAQSIFVDSITAGPDGNVWFTASQPVSGAQSVVGKLTPAGDLTEYSVPGGYAGAIEGGPGGDVWFVERAAIGMVDPEGQFSSFPLPADVGAPKALTVGPEGNLWFATSKPAAGFITPAGQITTFPLKSGSLPTSIAFGAEGDLWFAEPDVARIGRVDRAGRKETDFTLPGKARPNSIALGADGAIWFSDRSAARLGRITPAGKTTFIPVPTLDATNEVVAGSEGQIWFTAKNEIGKVAPDGKITWPGCYAESCEYPPSAMTVGPDGQIWVATGVGHCGGYCGGGTELGYIEGQSWIRPYPAPPPVKVGIGAYLAPVSHGRTKVTIGCGEAAPCRGMLRLRALVRVHGEFAASQISKVGYSLAAGATKEVALPWPPGRYNRIEGTRNFLIVDAIEAGKQAGKRGFYFDGAKKGAVAKHF
jgi:virginiamycin B lyase